MTSQQSTNQPRFHYEIAFADQAPVESVRQEVLKGMVKLQRVFNRIISCHVTLRTPHRHQTQPLHEAHIYLEIPGEDLVINNGSSRRLSHQDPHLAVRQAFRALHRQLRKQVERMQERSARPRPEPLNLEGASQL